MPWYAVLGNHDYGDGVAPGDPPPACPPGEVPWRCSAGPLTQVDLWTLQFFNIPDGHAVHAVPRVHKMAFTSVRSCPGAMTAAADMT